MLGAIALQMTSNSEIIYAKTRRRRREGALPECSSASGNRGWGNRCPAAMVDPYFPVLTKLTQSPWCLNFSGMVNSFQPPFLH